MVVVDSCVLILLSRIGKLSLLKNFKNVIITSDVYHEVVEEAYGRPGTSELKKACRSWIRTLDVSVEYTKEAGRLEGLEEADTSIILLAKEKRDILLTNDRVLIQVARSMNVECWWLTTLLLKLVKEKKISKKEAEDILFDLVKAGMRLRIEVYATLLKEIKRVY